MFTKVAKTPLKLTHYNGKAEPPHYDMVSLASENTSSIDNDANLASYQANCQCGAVILVFKAPAIPYCNVISCTCRICSKKGYLMVHSKRDSVVFQTREDHLTSYFIEEENALHKFCKICGSGILVDHLGRDKLAINVSSTNCYHTMLHRVNSSLINRFAC